MDRRTLLAIALCFGIFALWQKLYLEPRVPAPGAQTQVQTQTAQQQAPTAQTFPAAAAPPALRSKEPKSVPVATGIGVAEAGNGTRFFTGWNLKGYRLGTSQDSAAVDLKAVTLQEQGELSFDLQEYAYLNSVQGELSQIPGGVAWTYEDANVRLRREIRGSPSQPHADVTLTAQFKTKAPRYAFVSLGAQSPEGDPEAMDRKLIYWTNQEIERVAVTDAKELKSIATPVRWVGATNRYFVMTFVTAGGPEARGLVQPIGQGAARASLVYPMAGDSITIPLKAYFGPKDLELLRAVEPTLDHTVDFGWFTIFAYPLLKLMKWFYALFGNWGVSIILLTLLVKIVTFPLNYKSMKSMKEMQKLQPQLQRIREKYKDDREALNREMLSLMRSHGYNPMAGCLPILVQMPVFFALYQVLYSSIELYHAPFLLWINDLSAKDPFYVTPLLLTATMFFQQRLTPATGMDPAQQKMMQFMPIIFGAMMLTLPSGLTIYMLVNALASILQQIVLNKKFDTGHVPAVVARAR
jgi:YidC/Oxa1 family membrane protein insertase